MNWKAIANNVAKGVTKRTPELLTVFAITSFLTSDFLAVRATPKAEDLIVRAEDEKEDELTPLEKVKAAWKPYIGAAIAFGTGVACAIKAMKIQNDRIADWASAFALSQGAIKYYEEKSEEMFGEEKADELKSEVRKQIAKDKPAQEAVSNLPTPRQLNIAGIHPFLDPLSNTSFYASTDMLQKAEVALNKRLYTGLEPYVTIEDLYDELNELGAYPKLRHTAVSPMLGWTAECGGIEFDLDVDGMPMEQDHWDDGTPCYVMGFKRHHTPDYIR